MRICALVLVALTATVAAGRDAVLRVPRAMDERDITLIVDQAVIIQTDHTIGEVQIAQPEIADAQPISANAIYLFGRGRGRTTVALLNGAGGVIANLRVTVQPDVSELKARLNQLMPRERIEVRPAGNGVVLSGIVSGAPILDRAIALARAYAGDDVTNMLSVGAQQQVSLQVRIAEMNRTAAKELGIGLGVRRSRSPFLIGGTGQIQRRLGETPDLEIRDTGAFGFLDAAFTIGNSLLLNVSIDALERRGFARVLAEPNLVAQSGSEAQFLAGGEVPIPSVNSDGEIEVNFRPVGVSLNFRPTVLDDDAISIMVSAEVADVDPSLGSVIRQVNIPGFTVRRASTSVELRDGQSFAIAGLYQDNFADLVSQVPWVGNIPVVGALFRSADFQRGETELIVIVSANLVSPVDDGRQIETPLSRIRIPNETELFLFGQTYGAVGAMGAPEFHGPFGYVLD